MPETNLNEEVIGDIEFAISRDIIAKRDRLDKKCWELHAKLSKAYDSKLEQYTDMIEMGKLAQEAMTVWSVTDIVRETATHLINGD